MDYLIYYQIITGIMFLLIYSGVSSLDIAFMSFVFLVAYLIARYYQKRPKIIFVEGNIGSGKTTWLNMIEEKGIKIIREPVNEWQDAGILQKFYTNMKRWSLTFQYHAFNTRLQAVKDLYQSDEKFIFVERSPDCDRNVFAKNLYDQGKMTEMEWLMYNNWFIQTQDVYENAGYPVKPDGYIYLRTYPSVAYDRIKKRARSEEDEIPKKYLEDIHTLHERWLRFYQAPRTNAPVLVVDCNKDFENDKERFNEIIRGVKNFLKEI